MTRKKLRELERRISAHFYNEARIVKDILKANLTEEETNKLIMYMNKPPYAQVVDSLVFAIKKSSEN